MINLIPVTCIGSLETLGEAHGEIMVTGMCKCLEAPPTIVELIATQLMDLDVLEVLHP